MPNRVLVVDYGVGNLLSVCRAFEHCGATVDLSGNPAVTLPAGFHSDGLPVAIQLVARRGADALLCKAAALFEQARPWDTHTPSTPWARDTT